MSINEGSSSIEVLNNNEELNTLVNIPIRDHNDYYTLKDVQNFQIQNTEIERDVNLLFLIRNVIFIPIKYHSNIFKIEPKQETKFKSTENNF